MALFLSSTLVAFTTFFVIVDPIGTSAAGAGLTHGMPTATAHRIYLRAVATAFSILLFFGLLGQIILHFAGISLPAFRVAGGILLFATGFRMLFGQHGQTTLDSEKPAVVLNPGHISVYPLAIPLMSGPGCITALLLLTAEAQTRPDLAAVWSGLILVLLITLGLFFTARRMMAVLGEGIVQVIIRVMGLLLAAMAVQFITDGLKALFVAG
ncbi:MAG: MarC family protein [Pseudomonadota bacterium]|nr:MarC family protein [Pseudomonadota bacterium]